MVLKNKNKPSPTPPQILPALLGQGHCHFHETGACPHGLSHDTLVIIATHRAGLGLPSPCSLKVDNSWY